MYPVSNTVNPATESDRTWKSTFTSRMQVRTAGRVLKAAYLWKWPLS